jgi:zinc transporter
VTRVVRIEQSTGLIRGFLIAGDGGVETIGWDDMDRALAQQDRTVWLHFNVVDLRVRNWLARSPHLPPAATAILTGVHSHLWLEPVGQGLRACSATCTTILGQALRRWASCASTSTITCLITARQEPLRAAESLRCAVLGKDLRIAGASRDQLLHHPREQPGRGDVRADRGD